MSYFNTIHTLAGAIADAPGPVTALIRWFQKLLDVITLFFKTIIDPTAARDMIEQQQRRQQRTSGFKLGSTVQGQRRGPRIAGLSDFKDAGGNCAAGA